MMRITLAFSLKVGDTIEVKKNKHKVEKILGTYTSHYATFTMKNANYIIVHTMTGKHGHK